MKTARRVSALLVLLMLLLTILPSSAWADEVLYSETIARLYCTDNGEEKGFTLGHLVSIDGKSYIFADDYSEDIIQKYKPFLKTKSANYPVEKAGPYLYKLVGINYSDARKTTIVSPNTEVSIVYTGKDDDKVYCRQVRARVGNFDHVADDGAAVFLFTPAEAYDEDPDWISYVFTGDGSMAGLAYRTDTAVLLIVPWYSMTSSGGGTATPAPATPAPATPAPATPAPATPAPTGGISLPTPDNPETNWKLILIIALSCVAVLILVLALVLVLRKKKPAAPSFPDNGNTLPFPQPDPAPAWEPEKPIEPAAPKALALACHGGYQDGRVYPVKSMMRIGRREVNDIKYPDTYPGVSRDHAILTYDHGVLTLTDLSSHGTYLIRAGEQRASRLSNREPTVLHPGDKFYLAEKQNEFVVTTQ